MTAPAPAQRVLVVVPALNEAGAVAAVIADIRSNLPSADVLVVDDGSQDGTGLVARAAGAHVVRLPFNLGVGGAMRTGFRYAQRHRYDAVVQVDGDGQHDARFLPQVLAGLAHADVVIGARFAGEGDYNASAGRRAAMRVLAAILSRIARTPLTDVTSGFRAADKKAIAVFARHYPAEYLGDTVESLVIARRTGLTVTQVPVSMRPRATGAASQGVLSAVVYLARAAFALGLALVRTWPMPEETSA